MKLSDYVVNYLVKQKIKHVFVITGGAAAHLIDSVANNPKIDYVCTQHEQAAAMAADAYARVTKNLGAAIATSGPGATNLITGICCSHYDSIPTIFITGQVATFRLKKGLDVRQLGFQETDVVEMCKSITKYSVLVEKPENIRYELEKAAYMAKEGRPGPVLIDIPDNIQREEINPDKQRPFKPSHKNYNERNLVNKVEKCIELLKAAKRPVFIFGAGIKIANAEKAAWDLAKRLKYPIALTWATIDLFPFDYPYLIGGFGINGPRYGNFAVQNADLIFSIGSRLDTHATGSPFSTFAREAKKVIVDIDEAELSKFSKHGMKVDVSVNADAGDFLKILLKKAGVINNTVSEWHKRIKEWKKRYDVCQPEYYKQTDKVNPYIFLNALSEVSNDQDIIIADTGNNVAQVFQGYKVKGKQKVFSAFNNTPMGYALPASIGASFATNGKRVICIIGDGGIQMNIQELATIVKHKLPIKIFVFNNQGYGMIKQTQDDWLYSKYEASCVKSGVAIPDFIKIAKAYGLKTVNIKNHKELKNKIKLVLKSKGAVLCNLEIRPDQKNLPMLKYGRPIEDQNPLLDRKEFIENMIIKPLDKSLKN